MSEELNELRRKVALSSRILAMTGLVKETTGHVSARIPGTDEMFIRARGDEEVGLLFTSEQEVVRVDFDGRGQGDAAVGVPWEFPIHGETYKARPDVGCVVHAHPPGTLMCGIAGVELRPIFGSYDPSAMQLALEGVPVFPRSILISEPAVAHAMLEAMGQKQVCILKGHGITVTGATVEQATVRAIKLETLARVNWQARLAGEVPSISDEDQEWYRRPAPQRQRRTTEAVWRYYLQLLEQRGLLLHDPVLGLDLT